MDSRGADVKPGFVLDASTTFTLFLDDEEEHLVVPVLDLWRASSAVVPPIWDFEIANGLALGVRRGRVSHGDVDYICGVLDGMEIVRDGADLPAVEVCRSAIATGLSAYDASYVMLAARWRLPLATNDRALAKAARARGVALVA
jgi:predicted nucleic acid-binding protein